MSKLRQRGRQDDVHAWTVKRLAPYVAGLLNDTEERRLRDHLAACDDCSQRHELLLEEARDTDQSDHIPARLVGNWRIASARLRGLERVMVQHHLERCEECRRDLEVLGFEPVLAAIPVVAVETSRQFEQRSKQTRQTPWWKGDWTRLALGGWATSATAAALMLALMRSPAPSPNVDHSEVQPSLPAPVAPKPAEETQLRPPARSRGPQLTLTVLAARNEPTRGAEAQDLTPTRLPGLGETLVLPIQNLIRDIPDYPPISPVQVLLLAPDGSVVSQIKSRLEELRQCTVFSLLSGEESLAPGVYVLRVRVRLPEPAPADSMELRYLLSDQAEE